MNKTINAYELLNYLLDYRELEDRHSLTDIKVAFGNNGEYGDTLVNAFIKVDHAGQPVLFLKFDD